MVARTANQAWACALFSRRAGSSCTRLLIAVLPFRNILSRAVLRERSLIRWAAIRPQLRARDAPDFFGIGPKKSLKKPSAKPICHPLLESSLVFIGKKLPSQITQNNKGAPPRAEAHERIDRFERVIKEFAVVVDPGQTRPAEKVVTENIAPHLVE
jgi:hypothetical protein